MTVSNCFFDTHAHLSDESLAPHLDQVVQRAIDAGLIGIVAIGTTVESSRECVELASQFDFVWASVGIQPNECSGAGPHDWEKIVQLASAPKVVALGETGLDRHWDDTPWPIQLEYFQRHIELSTKVQLPLIIHMRDCENEMLEVLTVAASSRSLRGVMHSYTGSIEGAMASVKLGLHISFAGMVTYPKSDALRSVAGGIPHDRLLLETDSPYLSPQPKRGQRPNEPSLIVHTAKCVADARGETLAQVAAETTANARRLFGLG